MRDSRDECRVLLTDGRGECEVAPGQGGCLTAFRWRSEDGVIDWLRPAPASGGFAPNASACFPLVPYSNRIRDGRFHFAGRNLRLEPNFAPSRHTIHGHGWQLPWRVADQNPDRVRLVYAHDGSDWPAPYRAEQHFQLENGALTLEIALVNEGTAAMPAGLGLHPYFPRTPACRLTAGVTGMWVTDSEVMPTGLVTPAAGADPSAGLRPATAALDNCFTGFDGRATIDWPELGASLALECDPALAFLVVYTPAGADYFCAEPVSHCTDAVNLAAHRGDTGLQVLEPGERLAARVRFLPRLAGES
ncbi:MAG: aldose 1-epimerase [Kiloniellaceae bacterium]